MSVATGDGMSHSNFLRYSNTTPYSEYLYTFYHIIHTFEGHAIISLGPRCMAQGAGNAINVSPFGSTYVIIVNGRAISYKVKVLEVLAGIDFR